MNMHLPAVDPRVTHRVADGIGIVPGGAPRDDLKAWRRAGRAAALALPAPRPGRGHGAARSGAVPHGLRLDLQAAMARTYASIRRARRG